MCSRRTGRSTITATRIARCGASSSLSSRRFFRAPELYWSFETTFVASARLHALSVFVRMFPSFPSSRSTCITTSSIRGLRHADEVVFTHRVEDLRLRSELARQGHGGVRPLRRFLDAFDPLVRPIQ